MSIELLAQQGRSRIYGGLASVEAAKLRQMRDSGLRACFARLEDTPYRMEFVAHIHEKNFVNDAAARNVNATWFALDHARGGVIWIVMGGDETADYTPLRQIALRKVRMMICVGKAGENMRRVFVGVVPEIIEVNNLAEAVNCACYSAMDNVQVLFSPATRVGESTEVLGRMFSREVIEL